MISIIGAGPIGCFLGGLLAKQGFEVSIHEEHLSVGLPLHCTGIVTDELWKIIGQQDRFVVNWLKRAKIFSRHCCVEVPVNDFVLDRTAFDMWLAGKAQNSGARLCLGHKFLHLDGNYCVFSTSDGRTEKVNAGAVIGADGAVSNVAKAAGLSSNCDYYFGMQARVKGNFDADCYEVWLGSIAPGFFAWVVPESSEIARVGVAGKNNVLQHFNRFLAVRRISQKQIVEKFGGLIPVYNRSAVSKGNVFLVGDAAAQVKESTGGGLVPGLKGAEILAECIAKNKDYEIELKSLRKELWAHSLLRNVLDKFSDEDYDLLLRLIRDNKRVKTILAHYNRDNAFWMLMKLVCAEPRLLLLFGKVV